MSDYLNDRVPLDPDLYDELPLWSAPFGRMLLDRVRLGRDLTVLDVGCGTGFAAVEIAQRCGPGATVFAVDPWAEALERLRRKLAHAGIENVRTIESDAAALDLPNESVDVIVSNLALNNFENADDVLRTCHRVARPGAQLLITTNVVGHMRELYDVYRDALIEVGSSSSISALDAHVARRGTAAEVEKRVERAGFAVDETRTETFRMRFADGSALLRHAFVRLGFLPDWKPIVPDTERRRVFAVLERNLNAAAGERGELALTIPMAAIEAHKPQ